MFKSCDKDGSGQLSERELKTALVNGDWSAFDPHTVRMMIRFASMMCMAHWHKLMLKKDVRC